MKQRRIPGMMAIPWISAGAMGFILLFSLLVGIQPNRAHAQEPGQQAAGRGRRARMQRVGGTVTAISGANLTVKTDDGTTYQVVTTDNTRLMRGRGVTMKLTDLKPGDGVIAAGNLDAPSKTLHSAMVMAISAEQMKKMEDQRKEELADLGKTMIRGRVTAIDMDNATMTVERPDSVSQTIGFDEGTSFRRGRFQRRSEGADTNSASDAASSDPGESITLADIKVGDRVSGPGSMKDGRFVPKELTVVTASSGQRHRTQPPEGRGEKPNATQPGTQPPQ